MRPVARCLVAVVAAGCSTRVPVSIDVEAVEPAPEPGAIVPQFVELESEGGWIHVDFAGSELAADRLAEGVEVPLATPTLPKGRYEAVRFGFLAMAPTLVDDPGDAPSYGPESRATRWIPAETLILEPFCIGSGDTRIVLEVARTAPGEPASTRVSVDAPACD